MFLTITYWTLWVVVLVLLIIIIFLLRKKKWSRDPHDYDLRYFRTRFETDAWDGQSLTDTGVVYQHTLYREKCVHTCALLEEDDFQAEFNEPDDGFFPTMYNVAVAYRHIYQYLRLSVELGQAEKLHARHAEVALSEAEQAILEMHWQFADMKKRFADKFGATFRLDRYKADSTVFIVLESVD